jgi:hypothetical protein
VEIIAPQVVKSSEYEIIRNDKYMEARLYVPRKRTIEVAGRYYFLQFPQILAAKVILEKRPSDYFTVAPPQYYTENQYGWYHRQSCSFLNFAFVNDGLVYPSGIYQVDYVADKLGVCLVNNRYHGWWSSDADLTEMMHCFWTTEFNYDGSSPYFGSYHDWQRLNLNEVLKALGKPRYEVAVTGLDSHFEKLESVCHKVSDAVKKDEESIQRFAAKKKAEELRKAELKKVEELRKVEFRKVEALRKSKVNELLSQAWAQRKKIEIERPFVDNFDGERDYF